MVATFNGWEDMPEQEREALERWEEAMGRLNSTSHCEGTKCPIGSCRRPAIVTMTGLLAEANA